MKIKLLTILFPMLIQVSSMQGQGALTGMSKAFQQKALATIPEKLFVHVDKTFYVPGEIIWFKIYAVDGLRMAPMDMSKVVYCELLTDDHKPVMQVKIAMNEATGNGSFQIPASFRSGNYQFRAYTNWMKNAGPDYFFEQWLTIGNPAKKPVWPSPDSIGYDLQFFPEGGNLVAGIPSTLAFKLVDKNGKGLTGKGVILNAKNDTLVHFQTTKMGMGKCTFMPVTNEQYHALLSIDDKRFQSIPMPPVYATGMVIVVTEIDNSHFQISLASNTGESSAGLVIHTRGVLQKVQTLSLTNGKAELIINKNELGAGISVVTLFNEKYKAVSERLLFVQPSALDIQVKSDANSYTTRRKVTLKINTQQSTGAPVAGNLSAAVYLTDALSSNTTEDMLSYLWLSSDIKGTIESPAYYFSNSSDEVKGAQDLLMLTQGWRRFRWEELATSEKQQPAFIPEIEGHIISGKLVNKKTGQPFAGGMAYLSVLGEKPLFKSMTSDQLGVLRFNMHNFYGSNEIVVQTNPLVDSINRIDINNPFSEKFSTKKIPPFEIDSQNGELLLKHSVEAQVMNGYHATQQQQFLFPKYMDTLPFYGKADKIYYLDDYTRFLTMEEVMREYVAEVSVRKSNNQFQFRVNDKTFERYFETAPLILIDGYPIFNSNKVMELDPLKFKKIDVVTQKFYQNQQIHDGILHYQSYLGDMGGLQMDVNSLIQEYEGLQLQRIFYQPVYETPLQKDSRLPDFRHLLYWSPEVIINSKGEQTISFYAGDLSGRFQVVIQGITQSGLSGAGFTQFLIIKGGN